MKFTTFACLGIYVSLASALRLVIHADDDAVNGLGVTTIREGAGVNYAFLGSDSADFTYDEESQLLSESSSDTPSVFSVQEHIVQFGVSGGDQVTIEDGALAIGGSASGFYAAKNINDPYRYSEESYALTYFGSEDPSFEGAIAVTVSVEDDEDTESSSSAAATTTGDPHVHYWQNATVTDPITVTDGLTVTDYVTYCPEPTTITLTTCTKHVCNKYTTEVTEAKTVTVTGEVIKPTDEHTKTKEGEHTDEHTKTKEGEHATQEDTTKTEWVHPTETTEATHATEETHTEAPATEETTVSTKTTVADQSRTTEGVITQSENAGARNAIGVLAGAAALAVAMI